MSLHTLVLLLEAPWRNRQGAFFLSNGSTAFALLEERSFCGTGQVLAGAANRVSLAISLHALCHRRCLSGAAKTSSMTKFMKTYCEANAVSSTGKNLSGAAKTSFLKKCEGG